MMVDGGWINGWMDDEYYALTLSLNDKIEQFDMDIWNS